MVDIELYRQKIGTFSQRIRQGGKNPKYMQSTKNIHPWNSRTLRKFFQICIYLFLGIMILVNVDSKDVEEKNVQEAMIII